MPPSENDTTVKPWARVLAALYSSIASSMRAWVRSSTAYDRTTAAPTTGSEIADSITATWPRTTPYAVGELALEVPDRQEQRREADPHHERELPAVEQHHDGRDQHLADADHEQQAAEHEELADLVDVAGDPRDQGAAALGVLRQQRQVVHVPERLDPQRRQAALGGGEQPRRHEVRRPRWRPGSPTAAAEAHQTT